MQPTKQNPSLSVITVCLNAAPHILDTFCSLRKQSHQSYEYIVVDGGSKDETLDLIEKNQDLVDIVISEPDDGIADAMNKGLKKAKGKYVLFLNADDFLFDDKSLENVDAAIRTGKDLYAFGISVWDGQVSRPVFPGRMGFYTNFKLPFCHQAVVCRRDLLENLGGFDKALKVAMDYDFFLRAYRSGATLGLENAVLSVFRSTGISSRTDKESVLSRLREEQYIHYKNCSTWHLRVAYKVWWALYWPYRKFLLISKQ